MNSSDTTKQDANWDVTVQTSSRRVESKQSATNGWMVRIHPWALENKPVHFTQTETLIGRDPSSNILCDDTSISRRHAQVVRTESGFVIEDLNSTNGTFVNGKQVSQAILTNGCQVQVGNHIFKFLAGDSIESQYHETVYSMMTKDGLTNVYNKRYLVETISREFDRCDSYGRPFALIMMDIDFFKKFNDSYGHLAGDEVLQEFARRIQSECSKDEVFGRFGGEEFTVLLIETEQQDAMAFAEKLRKKICAQSFECCAGNLGVTASFGVAQFDQSQHKNFSEIMEVADQNLYAAKENGRNQVNGG